jgi:hypothetical protein
MEVKAVEKEKEVIRKALDILKERLSVEEYARFLAAITPKVGNSVKELREFRDSETEEEFIERMRKKGAKIV